jgi:DNA-binding transcriptional LysR family regulator
MEDHRLKVFCLVVEMKSFSKAAEVKFMTQSAISHLIKNLERELDTRLLIRTGKTVLPTPAGKILYAHSKQILEQYKKMENDITGSGRGVRGELSIAASPTAATYLLPQVFYNFSKKYPDVEIQLTVSNTENIVNELNEGKIDIGIAEGNVKNPQVFLEQIAEDEIVIISSDDNPLTKKRSLNHRDLISQPFIMPEVGSGIREFIEDFLRKEKIDPREIKIVMTLGSPELIVQMVQAGIGISFVSKWSVFKAIREGSVKLLDVSDKKLRRKIYLVCIEKKPSTMAGKTFREFVKEYRFFVPF